MVSLNLCPRAMMPGLQGGAGGWDGNVAVCVGTNAGQRGSFHTERDVWPECMLGAKLRHSTIGPTCSLSTSTVSPTDSGLFPPWPFFAPNVGHPQATPSLTWETTQQPTLIPIWDTSGGLGTVPSPERI